MRLPVTPVFLIVFGISASLVPSETSAQWWKKNSGGKTDSTQTSTQTSAQTAAQTSEASGSADSDRFLSRSEQEEKARNEEKAQKGLFLRFPWAKKESEGVDDPFGEAPNEAPQYQNLEELGVKPSSAASTTPERPASAASASGDASARAGSRFGGTNPAGASNSAPVATPEAQWLQNQPYNASGVENSPEIPTYNAQAAMVPPPSIDESFAAGNPVAGNPATGSAVELPAPSAAALSAPSDVVLSASAAAPLPDSLPDSLPASVPASVPAYETSSSASSAAAVSAGNTAGTSAGTSAGETASETEGKTEEEFVYQPSAEIALRLAPSLAADTSQIAGQKIQIYQYGQTLAQVGTQVILAGDVMGRVDAIMEEHKDEIPEQFRELQRETLTRMFLDKSVEAKLIYCDVLRSLPPEGIKQNLALIDKLFEEQELPKQMKEAGVTLREDYEKLLQQSGSSIQLQKYLYREMVFCQQWLMQNVPQNPTVSPLEISDYYHDHPTEFETPPRARWEELVIRKSRFYSRDEAYNEIIRIGSLVAVQKTPFAEVAQQFSHGVTAKSGGSRDWVKPGQIASKPLEDAIFAQTVGELSPKIIEDENCFYIVRVTERDPLVRKPFVDAQPEIKEKIKQQKIAQSREEYISKLRREIPVFTVFDGIPTPEERMNAQKEEARAARAQNAPAASMF